MMNAKMSCTNNSCPDKMCGQQMHEQQMREQQMREQQSCRPFIKPKSYHDVMKEKNELQEENKEYIQSISSLRDLNKKLIHTVKEKDAERERIEKENVRLEALSNTYLRTYTNMTIELLKLEEKLARLEGRCW